MVKKNRILDPPYLTVRLLRTLGKKKHWQYFKVHIGPNLPFSAPQNSIAVLV